MRSVVLAVLASLLAGCSTGAAPERRAVEGPGLVSVSPEMRIVGDAAAALGGWDAIRAVKTLSIEGTGDVFLVGQGRTLDGDLPRWQILEHRRSFDFSNRRWRAEWLLKRTYATGSPEPFRVVEAYDRDVVFDVDDGKATPSDASSTRERRAELYHHPIGFVHAAIQPGAKLEHARREGGLEAVDLIVNGERFTLWIASSSKLPVRIASKAHWDPLGDITLVTELSAFMAAGALRVPGRMVRRIEEIGSRVASDIRIAKTALDANVGHLEAPEEVRKAGAAGPHVTVDEVAPGIWYLAGEGHHSVVVEFADHLTLVEAPGDEARTLAVMAKARALRPGKPLTEVVNTHVHFDHAAGLRAAIAQGLEVITHQDNRAFVEKVAVRPSTVAPDALAKNPKPLSIETVADKKVLTDGRRRVELYPITDSGHCASMLMIYFPAEKLLVEADAYEAPPPNAPPPAAYPFAKNLLDNIEKRGLRVERLMPIHGRIVPFAELVAAARMSPAPR